jgi:hypothetical protein
MVGVGLGLFSLRLQPELDQAADFSATSGRAQAGPRKLSPFPQDVYSRLDGREAPFQPSCDQNPLGL